MEYFILLLSVYASFTDYSFVYVEARLKAEGIVGGTGAKRGEVKYQISLETERDNICGGGIIADNYVVTAAHCVIDSKGKFKVASLTVLAAALKARTTDDPKVVRVAVERIYVLNEYNPINPQPNKFYRATADLAVLKLKRELGIETNPLLNALELPKSVNRSYIDDTAVVAGFGYNWVYIHEDENTGSKVEFGGGSNDALRHAKARVIANDQCKNHFDAPIYPNHLCAAVIQRQPDYGEGVCSGDSGSPLVHNGTTVIGILSSSPLGCTEAESPAVYTRISSYVSFVRDILNGKVLPNVRVAALTDYLNAINETAQRYDEVT